MVSLSDNDDVDKTHEIGREIAETIVITSINRQINEGRSNRFKVSIGVRYPRLMSSAITLTMQPPRCYSSSFLKQSLTQLFSILFLRCGMLPLLPRCNHHGPLSLLSDVRQSGHDLKSRPGSFDLLRPLKALTHKSSVNNNIYIF